MQDASCIVVLGAGIRIPVPGRLAGGQAEPAARRVAPLNSGAGIWPPGVDIVFQLPDGDCPRAGPPLDLEPHARYWPDTKRRDGRIRLFRNVTWELDTDPFSVIDQAEKDWTWKVNRVPCDWIRESVAGPKSALQELVGVPRCLLHQRVEVRKRSRARCGAKHHHNELNRLSKWWDQRTLMLDLAVTAWAAVFKNEVWRELMSPRDAAVWAPEDGAPPRFISHAPIL